MHIPLFKHNKLFKGFSWLSTETYIKERNMPVIVKIRLQKSNGGKKMNGKVKWYNSRKGFGFIEGEDGKDIFVHRSSIPEGIFLNEGDKVEYETEDSDRGPKAINIKKV